MGNLLSLNPKIHRLRTDAKKKGGFTDAERKLFLIKDTIGVGR
jgi:hypothetical protein